MDNHWELVSAVGELLTVRQATSFGEFVRLLIGRLSLPFCRCGNAVEDVGLCSGEGEWV